MSDEPLTGQNQFLLHAAPDGAVEVNVFLKDETLGLTQKALAELFGVKRPAITKHLLKSFPRESWSRIQYVPFWNILPGTGKLTRQNTTTLMPSSPWATG